MHNLGIVFLRGVERKYIRLLALRTALSQLHQWVLMSALLEAVSSRSNWRVCGQLLRSSVLPDLCSWSVRSGAESYLSDMFQGVCG